MDKKEYFAFISYKREDEKWAKWLQHKLEHYKLPSNLNGRTDLPKEIRPIFRDQSELAGGILADEINKALTNSKYLIVICSPRAAQSVWVGKEVQTFIDLGRTDKIIPFIIGGTPHARNPEDECFPMALLNLPSEQELLGINIDEMGRVAAAVKVVAKMFDLFFDTLWQRYEREKKTKLFFVALSVLVLSIIGVGVGNWLYYLSLEKRKSQVRNTATLALNFVEEGDAYYAQRVAIELLPPNMPYVVESERLLRMAWEPDSVILKFPFNPGVIYYNYDGSNIITCSFDNKYNLIDSKTGISVCSFQNEDMWNPPVAIQRYIAKHGFGDDYVCFVSCETGKSIDSIAVDGYEFSVGFSGNGKKAAVGSSYGSILIYDFETKKCIETNQIDEDDDGVYYVVFSPDGKSFVSSSDCTYKIWDAETGELLLVSDTIDDDNFQPVFTPDGKYLVSEKDKCLNVYGVENGRYLYRLRHRGDVSSFDISPKGNQIVSASWDGTVTFWDLSVKDNVLKIDSNKHCRLSDLFDLDGNLSLCITSIRYSRDGKYLLVCMGETGRYNNDEKAKHSCWFDVSTSKVSLLDVNTRRVIHTWSVPDGAIWADINPAGTHVAVSTVENKIKVYDLKLNKGRVMSDSFETSALRVFVNPNAKSIIRYDSDGLEEFDVASGTSMGKIMGRPIRNNPLYSPKGTYLIVEGDNSSIYLIESNTRKVIDTIRSRDMVSSAVFSSDEKKLLMTIPTKFHCIWDSQTKLFDTLYANNAYDIYSCFGPDDKSIVTVGRSIRIWDVKTKTCVDTIKEKDDVSFWHTKYSPDNKYVIAIFDDPRYLREHDEDTLFIWNVNTKESHFIAGEKIRDAFFSLDSERIYVSIGGALKMIDAETGMEIYSFEASDLCSYSPLGGYYIYENELDHSLIIRDVLSLQNLIDQVHINFGNKPLTSEERRRCRFGL